MKADLRYEQCTEIILHAVNLEQKRHAFPFLLKEARNFQP